MGAKKLVHDLALVPLNVDAVLVSGNVVAVSSCRSIRHLPKHVIKAACAIVLAD